MKLKGKISILINREYTTIEIEDENANTQFCRVKLTPIQLNACLSRQGYVECEIDITGLDRLGKTHESKSFEFEIHQGLYEYNKRDDNKLAEIAQSILDKEQEGWIAEKYFNSQNSFFTRYDKFYARCTIRRWK